MKIGWLVDNPGYVGGAELTQDEFRRAAPEGVEVINCPPGGVVAGLDRYVVHNCVTYKTTDIDQAFASGPVVKYAHDVMPHVAPGVLAELQARARWIFTSPLHAERFPHEIASEPVLIPPAIDLPSFHPTRQQRRNSKRQGACSVGAFRGPGKGGQQLFEWALANRSLDVYGHGAFCPNTGNVTYKGPLEPAQVAQTLWGYETFVHLPTALEPFGRSVVEAWAAGCQIVTNHLVGARHWIEQEPKRLDTAAEDFWSFICG